MELFIAVSVAGVIAYEFYTGDIIVKNGTRGKALSRKTHPGTFWFWVIVQVGIIVLMLLEWFNITHLDMFS